MHLDRPVYIVDNRLVDLFVLFRDMHKHILSCESKP